MNGTDKRQQELIEGASAASALLRYDAFEDVGGRLSFSCAMLDDHGTGVVLTSINGRQETRVYAKPITDGQSSYNLSSRRRRPSGRRSLAPPRSGGGTMIFKREEATTRPAEAARARRDGIREGQRGTDRWQSGERRGHDRGTGRGWKATSSRPGACGSTGR